jgi:uncharacterized SAM-binding protein YcdF (DUF218 family)
VTAARRLVRVVLALLLVLGAGFAWFLAEAASVPQPPLARTDAIIVLTGGSERVETGLRLLEEGAAPRLLVSGVGQRATLGEFARAHGREPAALAGRVTLGHAATTTIGNAAEAAAYAREHRLRSLRVVTAGYHMPRAMLELGRAVPGVTLVPHPIQPAALRDGSMTAWRAWTLRIGEYLKYLAAAAWVTQLAAAGDHAR